MRATLEMWRSNYTSRNCRFYRHDSVIHVCQMEPVASSIWNQLPHKVSISCQQRAAADVDCSQISIARITSSIKKFQFQSFYFSGLIHLFFDIEGKTGVVFFSWLTPCSLFLFNPFTSLPRDVDSFNYWRSSLNPIGKENPRMNGANKIVHFVYDGLDENMRGQSFVLSLSLSLVLSFTPGRTK